MEGPPSDAALLVGVAEGDIGAFRTLYERHAGWLALRLARQCNDSEPVADVVVAVVAGDHRDAVLGPVVASR